MKNYLSNHRIVYLSVPESLREKIVTQGTEDFSIDPSIPIPVELPPGEEQLNLENLSWEMILSGMITVVAEDPKGEDAEYYRRFVLAVKPDIQKEFGEAAILKAKNGDFDLALEITQALRGLFPDSQEILLNQALILEERASRLEEAGKEQEAETWYEEAHEIYRELLNSTPPLPNALFNAGFFYLKLRNYERAKRCFLSYLPVAEEARKKARAQKIIQEIENRSLDDELFKEAYDFVRLGQEEEGLKKIDEFLRRHEDVWNGWFIRGWAQRRLGRWEAAKNSFERALTLGGDGCDTRNELALCYIELGDYGRARKELEQALRFEGDNIKVISNLGMLALKEGKKEEAKGFFRTVLEIEPEDPLAQKMLQELDKQE
ncbi:MAG: tetratricopeptide repeat protein [Treponemataceae bacterium]|nr:tetratricopeptide repeat protein [Treponemataceae bacterium]